ncbi:MAG: sensor histidine kinase [Calditrichia bacterium]
MSAITILVNDTHLNIRSEIQASVDAGEQINPVFLQTVKTSNYLKSKPVDIAIAIAKQNGEEFLKAVGSLQPNVFRILVGTSEQHIDSELFDLLVPHPDEGLGLQAALRCGLKQVHLTRKNHVLQTTLAAREVHRNIVASDAAALLPRERFMMMVNHELRTPATIVSSSLEMLKQNLGDLNEVQQKFLHNAVKGSNRMNSLLNNLLAALSVPNNISFPTPRSICLRDILLHVTDSYRTASQDRNLALTVDCPAEIKLNLEAKEIEQIVDNVLSNAMKYTPDGGRIEVVAREENRTIQITVLDNGIGIAENYLDEVLRPFSATGNPMHHHSSKTEFLGSGVGIGLTAGKAIVERHGGKLKIESSGSGQGSCVSIMLPVAVEYMPSATMEAATSAG